MQTFFCLGHRFAATVHRFAATRRLANALDSLHTATYAAACDATLRRVETLQSFIEEIR